ncbi:MAG TPA: dienelactone hydrolase family protein [Candidatus Eisenbacteria bacterium]
MKRTLLDRRDVAIRAGRVVLTGDLIVPAGAPGIVLFAHGSGSGRWSPRNRAVAGALQEAGLATLLFDLLTPEEEVVDRRTAHLRFDIPLLARRLIGATEWLASDPDGRGRAIGYFGASTGAAAALVAEAEGPRGRIAAIVSRGGRPDLAGDALPRVGAPTLLIVGGDDVAVIGMNRRAIQEMRSAETRLEIVPGATHLFEEPGALETVSSLARDWFLRYLGVSG